jgi:signal transduction histidine kinase
MSAAADRDNVARAALRALASRLPCGVLVLAADGAPCFASTRACALLGVADEETLCKRWPALSAALGISASALAGRADPIAAGGTIDAGDGPHAIRADVHAIGAAEAPAWLVLMQRRDRIDDRDAALIAASRANASRHVLSGLLHDLNGPLNNLNLTLALLSGTLPRIATQRPADAALERCSRHVDTMADQARRFSDSARAMLEALTPADDADGSTLVSALLHDAQHALRQHASLREVRTSIAPPPRDLALSGEHELLRLAFVDLLLTAIDAAAPGADVAVTSDDADGGLRLRIQARAIRSTDAAAAAEGDLLASPSVQWLGYAAARRILERHGGSATLHVGADELVIEARMPLARA